MMNDVVSYVQEDVGFYPTPPELVEKMLSGVKWHLIETVLEPSAGKGNIVYGILEGIYNSRQYHYDHRTFMGIKVDCIEIDPNLRGILEYTFLGKKANDEYYDEMHRYRDMRYDEKTPEIKAAENEVCKLHSIYDSGAVRIVGGDFLNYITHKHYDLIVMNPPFEFGAEHLLRAIQLQEDGGGEIICLLNAETIRNPYSKIRKVLQKKLEKHEAEISFLEKQFSHAERETDVEIAMVKIHIPKKQRDSLFFEALKKAEEVKKEKVESDELISTDPIQQMIDLYNFECKATIRLIHEYEAMMPYIQDRLPFGEDEAAQAESMKYSKAIITLTMAYGERSYSQGVDINEYLKAVRMKYWYSFFRNDQFTGQLTSNLRKEFEEKVDEMAEYDFSMFNIQEVLKRIEASLSRGVEETILATFDKLSSQHSWYPECQNNIHYYSGWKTNKAHRINKKVIIPIHGCFAYDSWYRKYDDTISVSTIYSTLSDIEKALNYLDNCETEEVNLYNVLEAAKNRCVSRKISCKYFVVTFYKKGTCHIEFTNERLLDKLNIFGSQRKNWLPPNYGKKHYAEMTDEEKTVIDEFQGEEAYEKVMSEARYYLTANTQQMLLGSGMQYESDT